MPFQKGHQINKDRFKDQAEKDKIGLKNSLKLRCPHCGLITNRARLSAHLTAKHFNELQYTDYNDYFIQSLIVSEEEYQKYLIDKTQNELKEKLNKKFPQNYLAEKLED